MTSVLLTGFEPFGGETTNPSWTTVQKVREHWMGDAVIHTRELPVAFDVVGDALRNAIRETRPDVIICVGQAGGAETIQVERVAINVDDARIPDNSGFQPIDEPIVAGGPAAYFSSLPIKAAVAAVSALGIPAVVSQTAGTYTCNHLFYLLMHELEAGHPEARGGFVHVPFCTDQAVGTDRPSMEIADMVAAVTAIVRATLATEVDLTLVGGSLD
ncbi:pyroglutamyl-peptidase I [Glaciihabitans arcticus]|uniref:Pyrrolidone-carboxylate peptidase n=1 Tax=Glaciihabitans arcticus TaxID=2668039 RepID=A0A4Q9GSJ3_9MICO|nr:pyroglutamyl-peptidase I [Glaciihabitans arcticus]TBN57631.1 pyroglutamyl-peptidase I [Glaciihabitans arcticus]